MKLYMLKREHHDGQTIYGVFQSEELALGQIKTLKERWERVPACDYTVTELTLNELTVIQSDD